MAIVDQKNNADLYTLYEALKRATSQYSQLGQQIVAIENQICKMGNYSDASQEEKDFIAKCCDVAKIADKDLPVPPDLAAPIV